MYNSSFNNESKKLAQRWGKIGFLEGISDPTIARNTAVLLENQLLVNEQATDTSDVAGFRRVSIPLVRRIFPNLVANKVVTVQPLLGPTGLVYYMRHRYSSDKGSTRGGSNAGFPGDDANSMMQNAAGDVQLDIWYSSQYVNNETSSTDDGVDTAAVYSPLEHTPIIAGTVVGTVYDGTTAVQTFSVAQGGTFSFTTINNTLQLATAGVLDVTTGELSLTWNGAPGSNYVVVSYEYNMECNADIPEINLAVESESIEAKTRKLKAVWTNEVTQDLRSQHSLDAEEELTGMLSQEINLEIDREIVGDLRQNAGTVTAWDLSTALGDTLKERYESLYMKVAEVSNIIHRKTLRGQANWLIVSPEVSSIFETSVAGFAPAPSEGFTSALGVQYVGTVNNRWKMYKDPHFPRNQLLMGYKGDSWMDTGYFFCPYVPLTLTQTIPDPDTFCPRKGIMTRYGKKLLREGAKFYARMSIANFSI